MFQPASVSLSGPAFSFLLYETCKGSIRQNGFLLGEIVHKEITSITDNDRKQVDISKIIKINSFVPCPLNNYFVKGRVEKEVLLRILGNNFSKVVGWYKYESFSSMKFTFKDKLFHKQFRDIFTVPSDLFSFCFLSTECINNFASYNYQQTFVRYLNGTFDRLSIHIPNLGESNNSYKNAELASVMFNEIISTIKVDIEKIKEVVAVTEIANAVQKYINCKSEELAKAEKTLFDLEDEVNKLKISKHIQENNVFIEENKSAYVDEVMQGEPTENDENEPTVSTENKQKADEFPSSRKESNSPRKSLRLKRTSSKKSECDEDEIIDSNKNEDEESEITKKYTTSKNRGRGKAGRKKC